MSLLLNCLKYVHAQHCYTRIPLQTSTGKLKVTLQALALVYTQLYLGICGPDCRHAWMMRSRPLFCPIITYLCFVHTCAFALK